jgi:GTP-binding protein LepA
MQYCGGNEGILLLAEKLCVIIIKSVNTGRSFTHSSRIRRRTKMALDQNKIRNFCIIAHIDHGKSTLADRIIEKTGLLTSREMQAQVLDNMDLERERGITIKAQTVRTVYKAKNGEEYIFNLIDTPGHVDFNYEVSRSLAACEGAILVVDAAQGIEAQTLANVYLAIDHNLDIMPVINKIDLPSADPDRVIAEIEDVIGLEAHDAPLISAKIGTNIEEVLEQIVTKISAPKGDPEAPLQALIFDSVYDSYKGVIVFCRIKEGTVRRGTQIRMMATGATAEVVELGTFGPGQFIPAEELSAGMVGYLTASLKNVKDTRVGDTITDNKRPCAQPLPGYKKVQPMVYCGMYPADGAKYPDLRDALEKLQLNDASLQFEPETSIALGFGFRCGFLGLLHLEIIQERLEREYNLDLITTAPSVIYKVHKTNGEVFDITNPTNLPDPSEIEYLEEPMVSAEIMVTTEFVGSIMNLCQERRGIYLGMEYMETTRALLKYDLPLNEIIYDFFDALKSRSRGYASFDYELKGYVQSNLVKLDILINKEEVDALTFIVHADSAYERGRRMCEKLKEEIPRQLFEIPIQAAIGSKIIARETVKAMRKDVLAKCYGGDITRKKKLLEKQKEGKKRMRQVGNVEIPQKAFMSVLKLDED